MAGGRTIGVRLKRLTTLLLAQAFTANKLTAIHAELLVEQAEALLRPLVGLLTSTLAVALLNLQLLRLIQRPRLERHEARASLQLRLTQLRLAQVTAQRHRSIQRLRLVRHTERVTARLQRLIPTLRAPLVMQLALADQRPRAAIHQP